MGNARLHCSQLALQHALQVALEVACMKLRPRLTIGIEGKGLLPYVEGFWAKTRIF